MPGGCADFGFDAAILFSDLLFPLEAMGMGLEYNPGPVLGWHLKSRADLARLKGGAASALGGLALILQLLAAGAVGFTGYLGGKLVYEHGANVKVDGQLVKSIHAAEREHEPRPGEAEEGEPAKK